MIGLVRLALRRPYTMAIAGMLIVLMGFLSVSAWSSTSSRPSTSRSSMWPGTINGLTAEDMERRVVLVSERAYSTTVNGIERIESLSIPGLGILKVYFQPGHRHRRRHRADHRAEQLDPAHRAARHAAAQHHPVQCLERAGGAGHAEQQDAARAADLRLRPQFPAACGCSPSRACRSRRRSAASSARSSSTSIPRG